MNQRLWQWCCDVIIPGLGIVILFIILVVALSRSKPQVIVQMPKDAKALTTIPLAPGTKVLTGDRAILWWTVYKADMDAGHWEWAPADAQRAVETVYGAAR